MVQRGILLILMKTFGHLSSSKPDLVCLGVGLKPEWVSNFHAFFLLSTLNFSQTGSNCATSA